jgi:hypothetical protein
MLSFSFLKKMSVQIQLAGSGRTSSRIRSLFPWKYLCPLFAIDRRRCGLFQPDTEHIIPARTHHTLYRRRRFRIAVKDSHRRAD